MPATTMPDLAGFAPLGRAEATLVDGLGTGTFERLGQGELPDAGNADRLVRAELVRALILGGPGLPRVHEKGLRLSGAWIKGVLDLEGCRITHDIGLVDCRFEAAPILRAAVLQAIFLDGSAMPGLVADRLEARGGVHLRAATVAGAVVIAGARLGGELVCDGATITVTGGIAIDAERLDAGGGLLLRGTTVRGGIRLPYARFGAGLEGIGMTVERQGAVAVDASGLTTRGDVILRFATVQGEVDFDGARITGDVDLSGGSFREQDRMAVRFKRAVVEGAFMLRGGARIEGPLSLNGATIGAIVDEPGSWPGPGDLLLNRCLYGGFLGAPADAATRLRWLALQNPGRWGEDFWPQPYEQLGTVLAEMGHGEDAQRVYIAKEHRQRRARRQRAGSRPWRAVLWLKDALLYLTVGYGRKPLLAFAWLGLFWGAGTALFARLEAGDALRPAVPVFQRSPEWLLCGVQAGDRLYLASLDTSRAGLAAPGQSQLACFRAQPEAGVYPRFNPWMYSLDALLPAMEIGQISAWAPDPRKPLGRAGMAFLYVQTVAGWALSLLAVAGFSGIVRSR